MSILRKKCGGENRRHLKGDEALRHEMDARRRVEEVIGEAGGGYWELIENSPNLIQSVSPQGRYFYVNRTWREVLGYSHEDAEKLTFMDVLHSDCLDHCMDIFNKLIAGSNFEKVDTDFVTKHGVPLKVQGNLSCYFEGGKPVATRGVFTLVKEHESAEREVTRGEGEGFEPEEVYLEFRDLMKV